MNNKKNVNILSEDVKKVVKLMTGVTIETSKVPNWNLFQQSHRNLFPESKEFDMGVVILPQLFYAKNLCYTALRIIEKKVGNTIPSWASSEIIEAEQRQEILIQLLGQIYTKIVNILSNQYAQALGVELTEQEILGEELNKKGECYVSKVEHLIKILTKIDSNYNDYLFISVKDFDINLWPDFNILKLPETILLQPWNITLTHKQKEYYNELSREIMVGTKKLTDKKVREWYLLDIFARKSDNSVKDLVETYKEYWKTQSAQIAAQRELLWREKLPQIRKKYNYHNFNYGDGWSKEENEYIIEYIADNRCARPLIEEERLRFLKECENNNN